MGTELVADCPRCQAKGHTFDVRADLFFGVRYGWQSLHEVFAVCRHCHLGVIFKCELKNTADKTKYFSNGSLTGYNASINDIVKVDRPVTLRDTAGQPAPEMVPKNIESVFAEGSSSLAIGNYNAAAAMFRLVLDLTTKSLLPPVNTGDEGNGPNRAQRTRLHERLQWLFENHLLPRGLEDLAACVKEDGNDGAHDGTISKADAQDLLEFSIALLERVYTEPGKLAAAKERRDRRRQVPEQGAA